MNNYFSMFEVRSMTGAIQSKILINNKAQVRRLMTVNILVLQRTSQRLSLV